MGNFKFGVSAGVYCTKCTLNTSVDTDIEIAQVVLCHYYLLPFVLQKQSFITSPIKSEMSNEFNY
jgi:hypothetical protein